MSKVVYFVIFLTLCIPLNGCQSLNTEEVESNKNLIDNPQVSQSNSKGSIKNEGIEFEIIEGELTQTFKHSEQSTERTLHSIFLVNKEQLDEELLSTIDFFDKEGIALKIDYSIMNVSQKGTRRASLSTLLYNEAGKEIGKFVDIRYDTSKELIDKYALMNTLQSLEIGESSRGIAYIELFPKETLDLDMKYKLIVSPFLNPIEWTIKAKK